MSRVSFSSFLAPRPLLYSHLTAPSSSKRTRNRVFSNSLLYTRCLSLERKCACAPPLISLPFVFLSASLSSSSREKLRRFPSLLFPFPCLRCSARDLSRLVCCLRVSFLFSSWTLLERLPRHLLPPLSLFRRVQSQSMRAVLRTFPLLKREIVIDLSRKLAPCVSLQKSAFHNVVSANSRRPSARGPSSSARSWSGRKGRIKGGSSEHLWIVLEAESGTARIWRLLNWNTSTSACNLDSKRVSQRERFRTCRDARTPTVRSSFQVAQSSRVRKRFVSQPRFARRILFLSPRDGCLCIHAIDCLHTASSAASFVSPR